AGPVLGSGYQFLSIRAECHVPKPTGMLKRRSVLPPGARLPQSNGTRPIRRRHRRPIRTEHDSVDRLRAGNGFADEFARRSVPETGREILRGQSQDISVRTKGNIVDRSGGKVDRPAQRLPGASLPELADPCFIDCQEDFTDRTEGEMINVTTLGRQSIPATPAGADIPHTDISVLTAR